MLEGLKKVWKSFYRNKRVLITGHTGFKGSWLALLLRELGAEVSGFALDPAGERDNFVLCDLSGDIRDIRGNICDTDALFRAFEEVRPEIVFHLAAQPLVRESYRIPVETYSVNVMGTINVLEAIRRTPDCRAGVMITTDKCYENDERSAGYRETDPLGGYDPYSSSKGACEIAISSWRRSFLAPAGVGIASARAGNVIGGGDWAKDRIVPDIIRSLESGSPVVLRNPGSVRPWQHVLEPLRGYLMLGCRLYQEPEKFASAWNFGPESGSFAPVSRLTELLLKYMDRSDEPVTVPVCADAPHEAKMLTLDISKARRELDWHPVLDLEKSAELTAHWYKLYHTVRAGELCVKEMQWILEK